MKTQRIKLSLLLFLILFSVISSNAQTIDISKWDMVWNDEFDYEDEQLDENWISQNGTSGGWVICSRWRENAEVKDGLLYLNIRKETKGGQDWTAASIWTKKKFRYGYYECRYKYAGATGTNNSFWLYPYSGGQPEGAKRFELDINEGHYPNEVNTNIHNWTDTYMVDGVEKHPVDHVAHTFGGLETSEQYAHELDNTVTTKKIRFSSNHGSHFHIREFRIFAPNAKGYPSNVLSESADTSVEGLVNHAKTATITVSGEYPTATGSDPKKIADGNVLNGSWVSQSAGEKWIEFEWDTAKDVSAIQFVNGWKSAEKWNAVVSMYKVEYHDGTKWVELVDFDSVNGVDFSKEYHTYGLEWTETEHKFYFDGELIRTVAHTLNHDETNILLSLALLRGGIAGAVTDEADGKSMVVDYVRFYNRKKVVSTDEVRSSKVTVFPNPVINQLNISYPNQELHSCKVYDMQGVEMINVNVQGKDSILAVGDLKSGFYVLKVEGKSSSETIKFRKQ